MNRTSFLATLVGLAGISLSVHANEPTKKLKAAKEKYLREVAKIIGKEKMEMWKRMQEQGRGRLPERRESGRPGSSSGRPGSSKGRPSGSPNKVEGRPSRPNLRKPTDK